MEKTKRQNTTGIFQGGTSSLHLSGKTKAGLLTIEAKEFEHDNDRSVIVTASIKGRKLYRAFFAHDNERVVFLQICDDDRTTTLCLSDTSEQGIGSLVTWNDSQEPKYFRIDINRFLKARDQKESIVSGNANELDLVRRRQPPAIKGTELTDIFGENPSFKLFMRGQEVHTHGPVATAAVNWKCAWICFIPACGLTCLFWHPLKHKVSN
jgi:hypothetical protein